MTRPYCEKCLSEKKKTVEWRNYLRAHPEKAEKDKTRKRAKSKIARESGISYPSDVLAPQYQEKYSSARHIMLYDEPCFFCEFGCCIGTRKVYVTISGKNIDEELGIDTLHCSAGDISKEHLQELLNRDKFIVCCARHASQIITLRRYHEEWDFDDVIEEVVRRCK